MASMKIEPFENPFYVEMAILRASSYQEANN